MTISEIKVAAEKFIGEYAVVAIRTQEVAFDLGEISHNSKVWDNGDETDEELDGISATNINSRMVKMHSSEYDSHSGYYYGKHMAIIIGNRYEMGEDDGEVIIQDATVVEILK